MSLAASLGLTLLTLPLASLGPGLVMARWLPWNPAERLAAAVGLSCIFLHFAGAGVYLMDCGPVAYRALIAISVLACLAQVPLLARWWREDEAVRWMLGSTLGLMLAGVTAAACMRVFSGGSWSGDWLEHYQRSRFFLDHPPLDFKFLGIYLFPARPPLANVLVSIFLGGIDINFPVYQIALVLFNALVAVPCVLLLRILSATNLRRSAMLLTGLLMLNPMILTNLVYPWTKLITAAFVLLSLAFYIEGWRKNCSARMMMSVTMMAAGIVAHYSAAVVAVILGLHYLVGVVPWQRGKLSVRQIAGGLVVTFVLIGSWLGWSAYHYGVRNTLGSNTTVTDSQNLTLVQNLTKIRGNLGSSLIPHPLRMSSGQWESLGLQQTNPLGWWRDFFFLIYQTNLFFAIGSVLGMFVLGWSVWQLRRPQGEWAWRGFLIYLAISCTVLGVAVHGTYVPVGVAHVCLQPVVLLALVAAAIGLPQAGLILRSFVGLGIAVDWVLGSVLQVMTMHLDLGAMVVRGPNGPQALNLIGLSQPAAGSTQITRAYSIPWLGTSLADWTPLPMVAFWAISGLGAGLIVVALFHKPPEKSVHAEPVSPDPTQSEVSDGAR